MTNYKKDWVSYCDEYMLSNKYIIEQWKLKNEQEKPLNLKDLYKSMVANRYKKNKIYGYKNSKFKIRLPFQSTKYNIKHLHKVREFIEKMDRKNIVCYEITSFCNQWGIYKIEKAQYETYYATMKFITIKPIPLKCISNLEEDDFRFKEFNKKEQQINIKYNFEKLTNKCNFIHFYIYNNAENEKQLEQRIEQQIRQNEIEFIKFKEFCEKKDKERTRNE